MDQEKDKEEFHDNEHDVLYDLYNACNGTLHNGVLDIRKLDDLSEEEREVLDIPRLKEVWAHVVAGCTKCAAIIATLNFARRVLRERTGKSPPNNEEPADSNNVDSISR